MSPDATFQEWQADAVAAFQAVAQHAMNVGDWGAVEWVAAIVSGLFTAVKVAKFLPGPWQPLVAMADQWLPQITGRHGRKAEQQAQKNLQVAKAAVSGVDDALNLLRTANPEMADEAVRIIKEYQDRMGIRDEVRQVIKAVRSAQ